MTTQYVYDFTQGDKDQKVLGGKGANLAQMTNLGLPVPPGFTITTEACREYLRLGDEPGELRVQVTTALRLLEDSIGRRLGGSAIGTTRCWSVRSGAKFSMPGMMETVLNVDLNDASVKGLAEESGDERFAWDSYPAGVLLDCVLEGLHQGLEGPRRPGRGRWLRPFRSWSYRERRRTPHLASPGRSCRTSAAAAGVPAAPPRTAGPGHQRRVRLLEHRPGAYLDKGVFTVSPFETIDEDGVGRLVQIAAAEGRKTRPRLKLGVCGEHGGDPESIHFFHRTGLDYVSCSPFRVPVARLEPGRAAVS